MTDYCRKFCFADIIMWFFMLKRSVGLVSLSQDRSGSVSEKKKSAISEKHSQEPKAAIQKTDDNSSSPKYEPMGTVLQSSSTKPKFRLRSNSSKRYSTTSPTDDQMSPPYSMASFFNDDATGSRHTDSRDTHTSPYKLPPIESSTAKADKVFDKISEGDISPEIVSNLIAVAGASPKTPVTLKNRTRMVQAMLKMVQFKPNRDKRLLSSIRTLKDKRPARMKKKKRLASRTRPMKRVASKDSIEEIANSDLKTYVTPMISDVKSDPGSLTASEDKLKKANKGSRPPFRSLSGVHSDESEVSGKLLAAGASLEKVFSTRSAVERARQKLKEMVPTSSRRSVKRKAVEIIVSQPSYTVDDKLNRRPSISFVDLSDSNLNLIDDMGADMGQFIPMLPKYEGKSKSRMGVTQDRLMASSVFGRRRLGLASYPTINSNIVDEGPVAEVPKHKFLWVYEWDLYEPYFTRNWTYTYHTPVPGFKKRMKQVAEDGKALDSWLPALTKIPDLPPPPKSPRW